MLIIPTLPNMWALKHAMYHDFPTTKEKYRWMMACVFVPCLAGVAYYFVGRKHASKEKVDIRARLEAERSRREEEKSQAGETIAAGEAATVSEPAEAAAVRQDASEAVQAAVQQPEPRPAGKAHGDDWSFGCPDDVRKPQA